MRKILVAGYGTIGKALHEISRYHHMEYRFEYIDDQLNCSIEEYFKSGQCNSSVDTLVNLTGFTSKELLLMCDERSINYIDTGTEVNSLSDGIDLPTAFSAFRSMKLNIKAIIGAGMNPGIIEVIYAKYRPASHHVAIELEYDSAKCANGSIFNTWSPVSFYTEYCINDTFFFHRELHMLNSKAYQVSIEDQIGSTVYKFYLVPHEEVLSIAQSNESCIISAFLYSPPSDICDYLVTESARLISETIRYIPVFNDITGEDCVGVLLHNLEDATAPSSYYYNRACHRECYQRYGVNGTSWQVVCGILSAIHFIQLLPDNRVYTMTDVAQECGDAIVDFLETLDFHISRETFSPNNTIISKVQNLQKP